MEEQLILFETAKLAKEKGLILNNDYYYSLYGLKKHSYKKSDYYLHKDLDDIVLYKGNCNSHIIYPCPLYEPYYFAPSQSLLQRWLREVHNIHVNCIPNFKTTWSQYHLGIVFKNNENKVDMIIIKEDTSTVINKLFNTYEEALEVGLQEGLKLI